jgi:dethiobiotin synthetase
MSIIIAGIHTGIGKTLCSAIICQALGYDYWKPVQAGDLQQSDSIFISNHVDNPHCNILPERYRLSTAASPHYAAQVDGVKIKKEDFELPDNKKLLIETAGGIMSPLSETYLNLDLIKQFQLPVVLVVMNYLGSINHTLLSYHALLSQNIHIQGIVFSGEKVAASEKYILDYTGKPLLFNIPTFKQVDRASIKEFASTLKLSL